MPLTDVGVLPRLRPWAARFRLENFISVERRKLSRAVVHVALLVELDVTHLLISFLGRLRPADDRDGSDKRPTICGCRARPICARQPRSVCAHGEPAIDL